MLLNFFLLATESKALFLKQVTGASGNFVHETDLPV